MGYGVRFREEYGQLRVQRACVREQAPAVREEQVQCLWYDMLFRQEGLQSDSGRSIKIISPGWWNRAAGPDFRGAQIEYHGKLLTGDVEIELHPSGWQQHAHGLNPNFNDVILLAALAPATAAAPPMTLLGRRVPCLDLTPHLERPLAETFEQIDAEDYPYKVEGTLGACASFHEPEGGQHLRGLVELAAEWRMVGKARRMRERMERAGVNQAIYEDFLYACGFSQYKHHFRTLAQQLPYDRVRQLALEDPMLAEAAMLQMAGLLPHELPEGTTAVPHFARLRSLRREHFRELRAISALEWKRAGVRPVNYPERRLAGAARFIARTAEAGLATTVEELWRVDVKPREHRMAFEALFPSAMGFWGTHCTWTGKKMSRPAAPIGPGRVRAIIGNVFIPAGLALARRSRDRRSEERIYTFFRALPKEADNHITRIMQPRIFGPGDAPRLDFRLQQGLMQMYQDWCEPNPSCRNCPVAGHLSSQHRSAGTAGKL